MMPPFAAVTDEELTDAMQRDRKKDAAPTWPAVTGFYRDGMWSLTYIAPDRRTTTVRGPSLSVLASAIERLTPTQVTQ